MVRVTIPVPNIASDISTYNKIEIGRAATKADADAKTGSWVSLGQVITLVPLVSTYTYDDDGAAEGQFHAYRLINSTTSAAGSWVTTYGKAMGYITVDEFRQYQLGDLTDLDGNPLTDAQLEMFIAVASRMADSYVMYGLGFHQTTERHVWDQKTRRVYPREKPIVSLTSVQVYVSNQQRAAFTLNDVFINADRGYVEVTSLATVTYSLFPAIVALGLIAPVAEITYTHGYQYMPSDVKDAVALTAVDLIGRDRLAKQGLTHLSRFRVGDMEMYTDSANPRGGSAGVQSAMPITATMLLDNYRYLSVR
jgi:hypothetical protein